MRHQQKRVWRASCFVAVAGLLGGALVVGSAGAQTSDAPGVTAKDVTLGYISSQTGVAAPTHKNAHKSCQARVDARTPRVA